MKAEQMDLGILGPFIDALDDEHKDKIVRAQGWTYGIFVSDDGRRCLLSQTFSGKITDAVVTNFTRWLQRKKPSRFLLEVSSPKDPSNVACRVAEDFDTLCKRHGLPTVVRACKLRAGASLDDLETETKEPALVRRK